MATKKAAAGKRPAAKKKSGAAKKKAGAKRRRVAAKKKAGAKKKKAAAKKRARGGSQRRAAAAKASGPVEFTLTLEGSGPKGTWIAIVLPPKVHEHLGGDRGRIPVVGTVDGHEIRTTASPMGVGHLFPFNKKMQAATGLGVGDRARFVLARDDAPRTVSAPADLRDALDDHGTARSAFEALSYSHQREYVEWIDEAKRDETRARRIARAVAMIAEGRTHR